MNKLMVNILIILIIICSCITIKCLHYILISKVFHQYCDEYIITKNNVTINLYGVCHISNIKNYYINLESRANKSDIVLFEGITISDSSILNNKNIEPIINMLSRVDSISINDTNYINQKFDISNSSKWINSDVDMSHILVYDDPTFKPNSIKFVNNLKLVFGLDKNNPIIFMRNNKVVYDAIDYISKGKTDIAIIYGNYHIPGILNQFKQIGFNVQCHYKTKVIQNII